MPYSTHSNLADSLVATAPSPATSGTSLTVTTGTGSWFPSTGTFSVTLGPVGVVLTKANSEIATATRSGDVLTLTRAQYGTTARTVLVGDRVVHGPTAADLTGIEAAVDSITATAATTSYVTTAVADEATVRAAADTTLSARATALEARPKIWVKENGAATPTAALNGDLILELAASSVTYLSEHHFDAQAGADGGTVITGDTGLDAAQATIVKSPSSPLRGAGSIRTSGTATRTNGTTVVTAFPDYRYSFVVKFESGMTAAASWEMCRARNAAGAVNGIGVRLGVTDLKPQLLDNFTLRGSPSARAVANGETWRFEIVANHGVTPMTADLYLWYPTTGEWNATADEHLSATGTWTMTSTGATRVNFGILAAQAAGPSLMWDSVRVSRAAQGPHPVNS